MTNEALQRVRNWLEGGCSSWGVPMMDLRKMPDTIEDLQADKAKMRKTLEQIAYGGAGVPYGYFGEPLRAYELQRLAIAALQETER